MMIVVDHVSPWFTPNRTLAKITHPHVGAHISSNGTGMPISQPAISTGLRPNRSDRVPAKKLVPAFTIPNAAMNVSVEENAVRPNSSSARSGRTVRSWPIIPPTRAFTPTSSRNWARFSRSPSRMGFDASVVSVRPVMIRPPATGWSRSTRCRVRRRVPRRRGGRGSPTGWRRSSCVHRDRTSRSAIARPPALVDTHAPTPHSKSNIQRIS